MGKRKYDFAGWVTKHDTLCSDGVTIKHDAFRDNDGQKVPLVWNHDHTNPENVLGHVLLEHRDTGVYGYGYFNESAQAVSAKESVNHGDISAMSIGARKIKRSGNNVIHGLIYEVSLVFSGANPGALITTSMQHSESGDEEKGIIYSGNLIHSSDDVIYEEEGDNNLTNKKDLTHADDEKTIEEIIDTMTDEQKEAVYALIGLVAENEEDEDEDEDEDEKKDEIEQSDKEKGDELLMKNNVFNKEQKTNEELTLKHSYNDALKVAQTGKSGTLKDVLSEMEDTISHGINSVEMLFPEAAQSTNGNVPILYKDPNTAYLEILNGTSKSPFSRVKTLVADLTEDEARAKGYIKGNMKKEEFFSLIKRTTTPTTVYKKQKLDRDDVIDITDFDVVAFMSVEMQMMLKEEIARAVLVGDGRDFSSEDKISEQNIRPILGDHEFFTIHKGYAAPKDFIEAVITAMAEYRGSGRPSMYVDPTLLSAVKLLKATDGRYLFGEIPSDEAVANRLGLRAIVPTTFMSGKGAIIVNLSDYTLGATKGGQITNFDDFDIDFNQYKYLIETRLSGALTLPKSAIHLKEGAAGTGADDTKGGMTHGTRQPTTTTTTTV